jgi:hypothetical protein
MVQASKPKLQDPIGKITKTGMTVGVAQAEQLPSKCETLSLNSSTTKKPIILKSDHNT